MEENIKEKIEELQGKIKSLRSKNKSAPLQLTRENENLRVGIRKDGRSYKVRDNRDRFFFPDEWMKFFDNLRKSQIKTFDCLVSTGARIKEIRNVRVGDIDFENKRIILRVTKVKSKKGEKNPRPRTIPISSQFAKRLKRYCIGKSNEKYIGILSTPAANIAMKKSLKKSGIHDWYMFSIHNIRKTLENWLIALDVDSVKISRHMGHDIATALQHYISPDVFSWEEKSKIRAIVGDLYQR
jgi:integrase